jgi:hypothetical protein
MPNSAILDSISFAWFDEAAAGKKLLDFKLRWRPHVRDVGPTWLPSSRYRLRKTRVKFASRLLTWLGCHGLWLFSLIAVIHAEKDPIQQRYNWQILSYLFHPALLLSDNIVVRARKADEDSPSA